MPGKLRRSRREVLGEKQWRSLEERGSTQLEQPKLTRSRTYESSCKEAERVATGRQGPPSPSLSKQDSSYRRVFGELVEQDVLLGCFSCAWQREMPYHGRLYVSARHICFHSNLLLKDIKAVVPVASISVLKKTNTALLVPNAVSIRTAKGEKFLFVSLRQREATYKLLRSVCKHLQDSGQSPRDSLSNEETPRTSQVRPRNGGQEGTAGGGVVPAPWMGWAGCSDSLGEKPQPGAAQIPGPSLLVGDTVLSGPAHVPMAVGQVPWGTHIITGACPPSDLEPVRPGAEHPGAQQPPGIPGSRECRIGSFWPRVPSGHLDPSLGYSSSVSWSPADEPNPRSRQAEDEDDEVALLVPSSSEWVPSAETRGLWGGPHTVLWAKATALWSRIKPQLSPLNIIILIYLLLMVALLLSSGYIGLRIAELEQQLAFVGAWPDLNLSQQDKT
ncbi:uncharacterized protein LOC117008405 isoform X2 [Catharus ustulatus]|nr:uncharacterized protein LOC117008405 isoform X2 [Catharus ustulatus]